MHTVHAGSAALIAGSPSARSKSRALLERAGATLEGADYVVTCVDLASLPAEALLGREKDARVDDALARVREARLLVAGSPVYRATYSGLLKVFLDLLAPESLSGTVAVPMLTGASPAHRLALDHGFRPLLASLGAVVAPGVYGWDGAFTDGAAAAGLMQQVDAAVMEAVSLARGLGHAPAGLSLVSDAR